MTVSRSPPTTWCSASRPWWRKATLRWSYYQRGHRAEKLGERHVKFQFKHGNNRELPIIMGQLPILPKHWWATRNFESVLLEPPLGSGPYKLGKFKWAAPTRWTACPTTGARTFRSISAPGTSDHTRVDYSQEPQEFSSRRSRPGQSTFARRELRAAMGHAVQAFPAVKDGRVIKERDPAQEPRWYPGLHLQYPKTAVRRPQSATGPRSTHSTSNGRMKKIWRSANIRARAPGSRIRRWRRRALPSSEELVILEPLQRSDPARGLHDRIQSARRPTGPATRATILPRQSALLDEAGWKVENGKRVKDGKPFEFEIIDDDPAGERTILPFAQNLREAWASRQRSASSIRRNTNRAIGDLRLRHDRRRSGAVSRSPGNEQREYLGLGRSQVRPAAENWIGIENPAVDKLIELIIQAPTRHDLIIRCRALDRVLQWNYYLVPNFHIAGIPHRLLEQVRHARQAAGPALSATAAPLGGSIRRRKRRSRAGRSAEQPVDRQRLQASARSGTETQTPARRRPSAQPASGRRQRIAASRR